METMVNNHLQVAVNHRDLTTYSEKLKTSLTQQEVEIVQAKYAAPRFRELSAAAVEVAARGILLKIHAITGWVIPESKEHRDVLIDQLRKKLWESYANCNAEEVDYAFRNFGTRVKDWGKVINLSMIDEVMVPYLEQRAAISATEEKVLSKPAAIENNRPVTDEEMGDMVHDAKYMIETGAMTFELLPVMLYDWLDKKGILKLSLIQKTEYLLKAVAYRKGRLQDESVINQVANAQLGAFLEMHKNECFTGEEADNLKRLAKQFALSDYLKQ